MLVHGIAVTASAYEDTKRILRDRYGDKDRIIQARLDYLEEVTPIRSATAKALNITYNECNRLIQAIRARGEDIKHVVVYWSQRFCAPFRTISADAVLSR